MMAPTHLAVSLLIYLGVKPFLGPAAMLPALAGGFFPDLDMKSNHRRDLHYPVIYTILATLAMIPGFRFLSLFLLSAAVHCMMEVAGNDADNFVCRDKGAVYDHVRQKWVHGREWIEIDGGNRDLMLLIILSIPVFFYGEILVKAITVFSILLGITYNQIRDDVAEIFPEFLLR
jgi:hypothetical protein